MAIVLALASSLLWGVADFAGGTATRRFPTLLVVFASQGVGLAAAGAVAAVTGELDAPLGYLPWSIGAGLIGAAGLLMFYHALAIGTMGVVSPIAALGVVVPVVAGFLLGRLPSPIVGVGIALAIIGVVAASGPERTAGRSLRPIGLAIAAAVCFGATLLLISRGAQSSPVMTMVGMRVASVLPLGLTVLSARRRRLSRSRRTGISSDEPHVPLSLTGHAGTWLVVCVAGLFDVAANLTFAVASTVGALAIVAILGSLYPAVTVLLARIIHAERLSHAQQLGVVVALVGVACIAGWS